MIHYTKPSITELEIEMVNEAMYSSWGSNAGNWVKKFEDKFSEMFGFSHAIATSSCTGALHMGLHALGIGPSDEVILADTNWVATVAPIVHLGAKPILVDINKENWCIDVEHAISAISPRTKAIIATHLYGNVADISKLQEVCFSKNIFLIEDAAEALGSTFNNKQVGGFGDFGIFSFHGSKTITTGEGGMFVSNSNELANKVRTLANHGRSLTESRHFWPSIIGYKYKMTDIQAALGLAQLIRFQELTQRKREIFSLYKSKLSHLPFVKLNPEQRNVLPSNWMTNIFVDNPKGPKREDFLKVMKENEIDARVFFWPLSSLKLSLVSPAFNVNSYFVSDRSINLPSYHDISESQQNKVIEIVKSILFGYQEVVNG